MHRWPRYVLAGAPDRRAPDRRESGLTRTGLHLHPAAAVGALLNRLHLRRLACLARLNCSFQVRAAPKGAWPSLQGGRCYKHGAPNGAEHISVVEHTYKVRVVPLSCVIWTSCATTTTLPLPTTTRVRASSSPTHSGVRTNFLHWFGPSPLDAVTGKQGACEGSACLGPAGGGRGKHGSDATPSPP